MTDIYQVLENISVPFTRYDHPAVFSTDEAEEKCGNVPGMPIKNLFLRNHKGNKHYLVVVAAKKQVDLKKLGALLNEKLGFASPERLMKFLGVTPGSVSLLGLIHDQKKEVMVIMDAELEKFDSLHCHPLINTSTLIIPQAGIVKFLEWCKNEVRYIEL